MIWEVEFTDEFEAWWNRLTPDEQESVHTSVGLLEQEGPKLGFPDTTQIKTSRHGCMRELRVQHAGDPYRVFYAFDPTRSAILLIGGNKAGDDRFYDRMVPLADKIYDQHLEEIGHGKKVR